MEGLLVKTQAEPPRQKQETNGALPTASKEELTRRTVFAALHTAAAQFMVEQAEKRMGKRMESEKTDERREGRRRDDIQLFLLPSLLSSVFSLSILFPMRFSAAVQHEHNETPGRRGAVAKQCLEKDARCLSSSRKMLTNSLCQSNCFCLAVVPPPTTSKAGTRQVC